MTSIAVSTSFASRQKCQIYLQSRLICLCTVLSFLPLACTRPTGKPPVAMSEPHDSSTISNQTLSAALTQVRNTRTDIAARLALANEYLSIGETFGGIEQLEIARTLGDRSELTLMKLAKLYRSAGETELAAETLNGAAALPNVSQNLLLALSQEYLSLGDFLRSARVWQPLLKRKSTLSEAERQTVARSFLLAGEVEQAELLMPSEMTEGADADWFALRGLAELTQNRPDLALTSLQRTVAPKPQDPWNQYLLGKALREMGMNTQALKAWAKSAQQPDAPSAARIGAANLLLTSHKAEAASRLLEGVSDADRRDPAYWQARAEIDSQAGHKASAASSLGYAAYYSGDPWRAEAIWRAALPSATHEEAYALYDALIHSALHREDASNALRFTQEAAARWPRDVRMQKVRAEVLLLQNQLPDALSVALRLQQFAPPDQAVRVAELLCRIALDAGNPDILQKNAQLNRTFQPRDPLPLLHLAERQSQESRSKENREATLSLYRQAAAIAPDNAEAFARSGVALADLKRDDEAATALMHALSLDPRVLDGTPCALLAQIDRRHGRLEEAKFEERQYVRLRQAKDDWPNRLKAMRQITPAPSAVEWRILGEMALERREEWIALCASTRALRLAPHDAALWQLRAAALKRFGRFDEALAAMRSSVLCSERKGSR